MKKKIKNFIQGYGKMVCIFLVLIIGAGVFMKIYVGKDEKEKDSDKGVAAQNVVDFFFDSEIDSDIKLKYEKQIVKCKEKFSSDELIFELEEYCLYGDYAFLARVDVKYKNGKPYVAPVQEDAPDGNSDETLVLLPPEFSEKNKDLRTFFYTGIGEQIEIKSEKIYISTTDGFKMYFRLYFDPEFVGDNLTFVVDERGYPVIKHNKNDYLFYYDIPLKEENVPITVEYEEGKVRNDIFIYPVFMYSFFENEDSASDILINDFEIIYNDGTVISVIKKDDEGKVQVFNEGEAYYLGKDNRNYYVININTIIDLEKIEKIIINNSEYFYDDAKKAFCKLQ